MTPIRRGKRFWKQGEPLVWATGGALSFVLLSTLLLISIVAYNGLGVFWPRRVAEITLADGSRFYGQEIQRETHPDTDRVSVQFKTANRELDPQRLDFRWVANDVIQPRIYPEDVVVLERSENGNFFGMLDRVDAQGLEVAANESPIERLHTALEAVERLRSDRIGPIATQMKSLNRELQVVQNSALLAHYRRKMAVNRGVASAELADYDAEIARQLSREQELKTRSDELASEQRVIEAELRRATALFRQPSAETHAIALADIVRAWQPNSMGLWAKCRHYTAKIGELLWEEPRESNTEGGLFPAIFGTVMLVFVMAIACFPLGVMAGVYLGEYAKDGLLVRIVRIAVNNLAGIPSIVYGIFGLAFFVYGVGGLLDHWFYPHLVDANKMVFGTGGLLWASLTLGLLTVPVVIVSTEEALRTIPGSVRASSLALGATKLQTLTRVLLPMSSPGIMTGFILAMARAAGEVAPLMITGVVKLAPTLPVDGQFPFIHPDRKFMHLGFHIFDIGFQSPNVEASKPMVFVTTFLLVLIVLVMSSAAIYLRNRMRRRFQTREI
ncbi:MAG: phosphate ABC transporter permease PstA [Pirellulaceae bacterium]